MTYIAYLIRLCLDVIPHLPEVANFTRTPDEQWTIHAELKDEEGELYTAVIRWQFCPETEWDGFIAIVIRIKGIEWHFRGLRQGDEDRMVFVGTTPGPIGTFLPWYEGRPGAGVATPRCSRCRDISTTVEQAWFGGEEVEGVARCKPCRTKQPYVSVGGEPPIWPWRKKPPARHSRRVSHVSLT